MSGLARELRGFGLTLRDTIRVFRLAPLALLLVIVPEFVQHVVEIKLGMFASKAAFNAHAMDAVRWNFGTAKLAGLPLAILFVARFWVNRAKGVRWWSLAGVAWRPLALGFLVQIVCALPGMLAMSWGIKANLAIGFLMTLVSLPGLVLMVAGLLGDASLGLGEAYTRGWGKALRIVLTIGPVWLGLQMLHEWDHTVALGQPLAFVWALMAWDSLVVGLMAALAGTGFHHAYVGPQGINLREVSAG